MRRPAKSSSQSGYTLIETLLVLTVLAICIAAGGVSLAHGLQTVEARGAAEAWQAAAAWAQTGALWQAQAREVRYDSGLLSVARDAGGTADELGSAASSIPVFANVARWRQGEGVTVRFLAGSGSPDSAGSLYFRAVSTDFRVTVRLESGLTVRSLVERAP